MPTPTWTTTTRYALRSTVVGYSEGKLAPFSRTVIKYSVYARGAIFHGENRSVDFYNAGQIQPGERALCFGSGGSEGQSCEAKWLVAREHKGPRLDKWARIKGSIKARHLRQSATQKPTPKPKPKPRRKRARGKSDSPSGPPRASHRANPNSPCGISCYRSCASHPEASGSFDTSYGLRAISITRIF